MDVVTLSRIQFAMTVGFHFIFPPISIGLAWLLVIVETLGWRRKDPVYSDIGRFFGKLLAITFAVGVATGITMEFQFGTNWAAYSKFVGDIFGAPLAAEAIFAFFLESTFLGLYLFGRNKVPRGVHWFSGLMVAVGSIISAFWIIVANSWQQTPAGFTVRNGRAELTDFWAAVFNDSTWPRFFHTVDAALITGAFFMAGIAAFFLLKGRETALAKRTLQLAIVFGLGVSLLELFPFGHVSAQQVAQTQPAKFAAFEGLYESRDSAPLVVFAVPGGTPPQLRAPIEIPGLLSWMAFGDANATVQGINDIPADQVPPLFLTFVSFHNMVVLGLLFIAATLVGSILLWRKKLWDARWFLWIMVVLIPFPVLASQLGWITAEVGRQPWIVYQLLRTVDASSFTVPPEQVLFSIIMFGAVYLLLGVLYIYLLVREISHQGRTDVEAKPAEPKEVYAS